MTVPISVQLYSVRNALAEDLPGTLDRIAALGFENVELFGFVDKVDQYRDALAASGLTALSAHAMMVEAGDVERTLEAAAALGVQTLIDPAIRKAWGTAEAVSGAARRLGEIAVSAQAHGLTIGYHNHEWEFENKIDGRPAFELFVEELPPAVVLELDTYWAEVGGVSAADLLTRLGDRVRLIHVKDGPGNRDTAAQQPAGAGSVPVREILAAAPDAIRVIEFDDYSGDVFDGIAQSLRFLREQGE
ncbi:MAG: sugar phosphate isomerase/epimerase [Actinomycetota bacterium]|nr:sugar phosphate isomerase/epimerase [Actinomycetota bacterium]